MNGKILLLIILLSAILLTCNKVEQTNEPTSNNLNGSKWQLTQIDTVGAGSLLLSQADTIILCFNNELTLSGESPGLCGNTYYGVYSMSINNSLRIDSLMSTKINCPNSRYWDYYFILLKAGSFQRDNAQLSLYCDNNLLRLVYRSIK